MTKDGKENRFGRFILEDEQAERIVSGDMSAVWEFIENNVKFLTGWARKFLRNHLSFLPNDMYGKFYKPEECINQIYVDFPFYDLESAKTLGKGIARSFRGITCGGYRRTRHGRYNKEISIDAPLSVSDRGGESETVGTLKDILPSREPTPSEAIERKEHVAEIAPHYFREIGRIFRTRGARGSGATIGEIIAYKQNDKSGAESAFQDVIEEVFFGYTFEEVKKYAERTI